MHHATGRRNGRRCQPRVHQAAPPSVAEAPCLFHAHDQTACAPRERSTGGDGYQFGDWYRAAANKIKTKLIGATTDPTLAALGHKRLTLDDNQIWTLVPTFHLLDSSWLDL